MHTSVRKYWYTYWSHAIMYWPLEISINLEIFTNTTKFNNSQKERLILLYVIAEIFITNIQRMNTL